MNPPAAYASSKSGATAVNDVRARGAPVGRGRVESRPATQLTNAPIAGVGPPWAPAGAGPTRPGQCLR